MFKEIAINPGRGKDAGNLTERPTSGGKLLRRGKRRFDA
jgi:hypothetical protein